MAGAGSIQEATLAAIKRYQWLTLGGKQGDKGGKDSGRERDLGC